MRLSLPLLFLLTCFGAISVAHAAEPTSTSKTRENNTSQQVEITADQSLEYYQDKKLYVARTNAKAVRGTLTVTANILTAHERDKASKKASKKAAKSAESDDFGSGDIARMTADGNVVITDRHQRITGEHAVYDLDKQTIIVTGGNLKYETDKEIVTATDSLEYYGKTKLAVARGKAKAKQNNHFIEGDILTAEFKGGSGTETQLSKMTAQGHVSIITGGDPVPAEKKNSGGDVSRSDKMVYDAKSNMAVISGNVKITRKDGTQLSGDVGEVDFKKNENRLINNGSGRVRALLPSQAVGTAGTSP